MRTPLRAWIVVLAATSFLAGTGAGVLLAASLREPVPEPGPFADYRRMLVEAFELSPEREELLDDLLWNYHRDIENLKFRQLEAAKNDLARLGLNYRRNIRDAVLPPDRREEFDRLAAVTPPTPRPR